VLNIRVSDQDVSSATAPHPSTSTPGEQNSGKVKPREVSKIFSSKVFNGLIRELWVSKMIAGC